MFCSMMVAAGSRRFAMTAFPVLFLSICMVGLWGAPASATNGGHWCGADDSHSPTCSHDDPQSACQAWWQEYTQPSNSALLPGHPTPYWYEYHCDWQTVQSGCQQGGCTTVLPNQISYRCDDLTQKARMPGYCTSDNEEQEPLSCDNPSSSNPIIFSTGAKVFEASDFSTADGRLSFERKYRSLNYGPTKSFYGEPRGFGVNWRFNSQLELHLNDNLGYATAVLLSPDGTSYNFSRDSSSGIWKQVTYSKNRPRYKLEYVGTWPTASADVKAITRSPSSWRITDDQDKVWLLTTQIPPGSSLYLMGLPTTATSRDGYVWSFAYDAGGLLQSITDSFGRLRTFTWLIETGVSPNYAVAFSEVGLPGGGKLRYTYDKAYSVGNYSDRLTKVEQVDASGAVTESTSYLYENTDWRYHITGIVDGRGVRISTVTCDSKGRATTSELANGADHVAVVYSDTPPNLTRTVTNALGKVAHYKYTATGQDAGKAFVRMRPALS